MKMAHNMQHSEQPHSDPNNEQCKIAYPNQYAVPPMANVAANNPLQYYQPVNGHDGSDPSSLVVQLGHHPSQSQVKWPWWIWAIAVADILIALLFAARVGYTVVTKDAYITDRDTLMWVFFLMFLSLAVQFLMGVALILGLCSTDESTTVWYLQGWLCGAYFLIGETGVILLGSILKLESGGDDVGYKVILVSAKTCFRVISFILVRRFLYDFRKRSLYRVAEAEQQQHQMLMQHFHYQRQERLDHQIQQQLQEDEFIRQQQILQLQQQQQQQQQVQQTPPSSANATQGGSSEFVYYAPQMSYMMSMMMNNSSST